LSAKEKANLVRDLKSNSVFTEGFKKIREDQIAVFLNTQSQIETIQKAHDIIGALNKIEDYFNTVLTDEVLFDRKN
jgi:hypothetical protein